ncbi:adenosine receptor A2a isoform X2 [Folsomia candida]|nr:adenosine receptor A2a isoform X2 [Folsomia candida]
MYFRERDPPAVDVDLFLATALPKLLMAALIIFLNGMAIAGLVRSSRTLSSLRTPGLLFLPQSTQGLLHSLFAAYLALGLITFYSQVSLSAFVLLEWRIVAEQGSECLLVNCAIIALSIAISLHLLSLAVDRVLAERLSYSKYSQLSQGTVPLWLLAIWLPSGIIGALPLSGWRNPFNFCIFLHQFNDDYLRFVGGFHFATLAAIPAIFVHLHCFIRRTTRPSQQRPPVATLYRWQRKLRSQHGLIFVAALSLNALAWSPFHAYLLLVCATCPLSAYGSGFLHEYLFILALLPAILLPALTSIRASVLTQCATKVATSCSRDRRDTNPMSSQSSKLFSIHDHNYPTRTTTTTTTTNTATSSSIYRDTLTGRGKGSLFLPRYLPPSQEPHIPATRYVKKKTTNSSGRRPTGYVAGLGMSNHSFERESPSTQDTTDSCGGVAGQEEEEIMDEEPYYSQIIGHTLPRHNQPTYERA